MKFQVPFVIILSAQYLNPTVKYKHEFKGFAGRNKNGKKHELQARALALVKIRSTPMQAKIRELYKASQESQAAAAMMGQGGQPINPYPGGKPS